MIIVAGAAIGLAGCGSSAGDDVAAPSPSSAQTNAATPPAAATTVATAPSSAPPATEGSADPCGLVSPQEAQQLAGTPLLSPAAVDETCTYAAPPNGPTAQVEVRVGQTALAYYTAERATGHEMQPLSGVGDQAFIWDYAVFVAKGAKRVSINLVRGNDPAENRGPLENLARTVAARI